MRLGQERSLNNVCYQVMRSLDFLGFFCFCLGCCCCLGFLLLCFGFVFWPLFSHHQTLENICCSCLEIGTALSSCLTVFCSFIDLSIVLYT